MDKIRDLADPTAVYLPSADDQEVSWLRDSIDRAAGLQPKAEIIPPASYKAIIELTEEPDVQLRRALRIAQSSNFRREYPFDWGGMTRLTLAAKASTMVARELLRDPRRRPVPYAARIVPKDDGRTRLKAGPWPEDSLLQQYVLSELLRARQDVPGWYTGFPAVRRIRTTSATPIMTGPDELRPVGPPDEPTSVVSFAYQIDQEIIEGEAPPVREGMFVPYRECWQQFIDHLDNFVARQPLDVGAFYAVRLDISGFFDNLPRYAVDNVLRRTLANTAERYFTGRAFNEEVAKLLAPNTAIGEENNRARAEFIADWLANQSFGFRYFHPSDGRVTENSNATIGVPQGPDLSAFLANMALFPLDHAVTSQIETERTDRVTELHLKPKPAAVYGRYVDDMVIISTSETLLSQIETLIGESLRQLGLAMNSKHERTKALNRLRIREWLLGEKGAAVMVSASGAETPSTERARIEDLLVVTSETPRSRILQLLYQPDLYSKRWAFEDQGKKSVETSLRNMRNFPSIKLRYNDWISAARWALHSFISRNLNESAETIAKSFWDEWSQIYGRDTAEESFGESERDYANRQAQLTLAPLTLAFDGLERSIDSRHDRRTGLDHELRRMISHSREKLAQLIYEADFCEALLNAAKRDSTLNAAIPRVETMLRIQSFAIRGIAATVCAANGSSPHPLSLAPTSHYALRRFAINALDRDIATYAIPLVKKIAGASEIAESPEAEPLLGLHEAIARIFADGSPDRDPLEIIGQNTYENLQEINALVENKQNDLDAAFYLTALTNQFLANPAPLDRGPEAREALRAFIEIVAGAPESSQRLQERQHLMSSIAGTSYTPIAVSPSVDVRAFFALEDSQLKAFSVIDDDTKPSSNDILFGITATANATVGEQKIAAFNCIIPPTHTLFRPQEPKVKPEDVTAEDVKIFAQAYRDLAITRAKDMGDGTSEADSADTNAAYWPVTPFHLFEPVNTSHSWQSFGAIARLPVEAQAFVRLTQKRLHSVAVYANGKHLWQIGFALADTLGYRSFVRSSELDRLSVTALEPDDTLDSIPFYMMQLTVPRLCGAFLGRGRTPLKPSEGLPSVIEHHLKRLEELTQISDNTVHLTRLLELGAETKAAELLRESPAPLQVAGALSTVFRAVGRAASRSEPIFAKHLPKTKTYPITNRRVVDLWLAGASRLKGLSPEHTTKGLKTAAAAMHVLAISRLLQTLTLEVWSLLSDTDQFRLKDFIPNSDELDLPQEILLVSKSHSQSTPTANDQVVRLINVLTQHAAPGVTARSSLDQITPLGWLVALATITGLIEIEPLPEFRSVNPLRPELLSVRKKSTKDEQTNFTEQRLYTLLKELAQFLAQGADDKTVDAVQDASWPWCGFAPLVDNAAHMVDVACDAACIVEQLYGLVAETRSSPLFQVSEADDKGYCLVLREAGGRQNLAGWQIDRDSIGTTRLGDLECQNDSDGRSVFIWSETRVDQRLVGLSIGYRSLADFAGISDDNLVKDLPTAEYTEHVEQTLKLPDTFASRNPSLANSNLESPLKATIETKTKDDDLIDATQHAKSLTQPSSEDALSQLKRLWHNTRRPRTEARSNSALRIAFMQMNMHDIGHSYYHPICETSEKTYHKWELHLKKIRDEGLQGDHTLSTFEAKRRAILKEALERCQTLDVELLVLPEYSMRADTIIWLAKELEHTASRTSIIAGSFRQPPCAKPLTYHSGVKGREISLAAIITLLVPAGALNGDNGRTRETRIYSRFKKYPSTGLSELIRPEDKLLKAIYNMGLVEDKDFPERLRYVRDLVCSEVFVAMAPANIYSTVPPLLELYERFGLGANANSEHLQKLILDDLKKIGIDTSPAISRPLAHPRQTIMAVPAATTRAFDHHIFGEAGAKAAGLTTVFTNMAGNGGGQSCFIGCYRPDNNEGSSVSSLQSPYHGRAPGIWTYNFPGGAPLGKEETALVVAEVNPIDTVMSKPARQLDTQPIKLIAHIPFFIEKDKQDEKIATKVSELAKRILSLSSTLPTIQSSCGLNSEQIAEIHDISKNLAILDKTAEKSLKLRAEGARMTSIQPHVYPSLPLLIDWAYIAHPKDSVEIEVPHIHAVNLNDSYKE